MIIVLITIKIIIIIPRSSEFPVPGGGRVGLGRPQGVLLGVETGPDGLGLTSIYQSAERGTQRGDSREQMGRRVPLCAGPGQALLQPPERGAFGDTLGLEIRTRLSILISSFSAPPSPLPHPHLGTWVPLVALGTDSGGSSCLASLLGCLA